MRCAPAALLAAAAALWVAALLGLALAGDPVALIGIGALALATGSGAEWWTATMSGLGAAMLLAVADQVAEPGRFSLASDGVFYAVIVLGPVLIGCALRDRARQIRRLDEERAAVEARRLLVARAARAEEAERVNAEVDLALADRLRGLVRACGRADTDLRALEVVEVGARAALADLRGVLGALHEPHPEPPAPVAVAGATARPRRPDHVDVALFLLGVPLAIETAHGGPVLPDILAAMAQSALLPLARRRPIEGTAAVFAVAALQSAFLAPLPPTVSWLLPALAVLFLAGSARTTRASMLGLVTALAGNAVVTIVTPAGHRALAGFVPGIVLGVLAWAGGRWVAHRGARAGELRAIAAELRRTEPAVARLAAGEQRTELARELHDVGAHALTVACLQAGAARTWWDRDRERSRAAVAALQELADGALTALGDSLLGLVTAPLGADLVDVAVGVGRVLGLRVEVAVSGTPRTLPDDVAGAAARVVQEALTNAARHAAPERVVVEVEWTADALRVRVRGSGASAVGTPLAGAGLGLRGMRQRVEALRGVLVAGPAGAGFEVLATLPA